MLELYKQRRSIRKFTSDKISKENIESLKKAALLAPTSRNLKPIEFIFIEDTETIHNLKKCKKFGSTALETATLAIVMIGDGTKSDVWIEDAAIATTFIMLEAEALGLGSNWIQMRLREGENAPSEEEVRTLLGIPKHYGVLSVLAIGNKNEVKEAYSEEDLDFSKIHENSFQLND
ncbi:nitroreductase family protein [Clostridium sp. Marseille-P299]|uniref:nitroreductase family protein n=1 Tax=Clostridium sp. Marseille-P299 TaxID=1805477 RepID=UPI0008316FCC|nr:nitroreductase family protein [Clostridium sp. Marseille-P299]